MPNYICNPPDFPPISTLQEKLNYIHNNPCSVPNHLHVPIDFSASSKSINAIVSNGKRFMAYELVKRLQKSGNDEWLKKLMQAVAASDKDRGKKHQVFKRSFDCKLITTNHFF
ncbi:hypothetical protein EFY79_11640 [Hanamia caeni]|uniref:Uncharacterized protein n=1 Tax=Hanamia caeni TaxID=2294116 RepID=A0A3M9NCY1_9BACT|nr:hypothetical protein EFY79_11640 [Hanamia caeni]